MYRPSRNCVSQTIPKTNTKGLPFFFSLSVLLGYSWVSHQKQLVVWSVVLLFGGFQREQLICASWQQLICSHTNHVASLQDAEDGEETNKLNKVVNRMLLAKAKATPTTRKSSTTGISPKSSYHQIMVDLFVGVALADWHNTDHNSCSTSTACWLLDSISLIWLAVTCWLPMMSVAYVLGHDWLSN